MRQRDLEYLSRALVEPVTLAALRPDGDELRSTTGSRVAVVEGIPVFAPHDLTGAQSAELDHTLAYVLANRGVIDYRDRSALYGWALPWLEPVTNLAGARIVCVGGSFVDDLAGLKAEHKFNVDHLAHRYVKFAGPEMEVQQTTFVSAPAETLPFATEAADLVYCRNAIDHFDNPFRVLIEMHRILAEKGTLVLACYLNSTFVDDHESKVVDADFIERFVQPLFRLRHVHCEPVPQQLVVGQGSTQFVYLVGEKQSGASLPYAFEVIDAAAELANRFQQAITARVGGDGTLAKQHFAAVVTASPFVPTDAHRQVFSALQILCMTDAVAMRAAGATLRRAGLGEVWRDAANLVFGHHGITLDDCQRTGAPIEVPGLFSGRDWQRMLSNSAAAVQQMRLPAEIG